MYGSPVSRRSREGARECALAGVDETRVTDGSLPPAYRPPLGGVRKRLENRLHRSTRVDGIGRIVADATKITAGDRPDLHSDRTGRGAVRAESEMETGRGSRLETPRPLRWPVQQTERPGRRRSLGVHARERRKRRGRKVRPPVLVLNGTLVQGMLHPSPLIRSDWRTRTVDGAPGGLPSGQTSRPAARGLGVNPGRPTTKDPRLRAHRTAAVLLKCAEPEGKPGPSYADVMRLAKGKISLEELDITNTRIRRAQVGGLKTVLAESEFSNKVSVLRPVRRAEIRLIDIDLSVSTDEVTMAVAANGQVSNKDIRTGPFRPECGGLNTIWVQCPLSCTNPLLKAGKIRLSWSSVRIVPLAKRRPQCFRCFAVGHTRTNCQSLVDRSNWCFQCDRNDGHRATGCRIPPKCPVCAARGLAAGHRAGAPQCTPYNGHGQAPVNTESGADNMAETSAGTGSGGSGFSEDGVGYGNLL